MRIVREANAGAAHPVDGEGGDIQGTMAKKVEEDSAANIRSLAARNGRNPQLAEEAVLKSRSFTADEALQSKLIDLIAPDVPALVAAEAFDRAVVLAYYSQIF